MSLPKIQHPTFKVDIPSLKKQVSFRPYTVREEKLLLMLKTNDDVGETVDNLKQIISNCCMENINVDKLALFDVEYIFIKLRSKSVGETIELVYTKGDTKTPFKVDLEAVSVVHNPDHKTKFMLTDDIGVNMNYPSFKNMVTLEKMASENLDDEKFIFDLFTDCIDSIFDDSKVYTDFTKEEMEEFVLSLPLSSIEKIKQFFDTIPKLEHEVPVRLKDGTTETVVLRGLKDFFIF
jgi:hypothetical protein